MRHPLQTLGSALLAGLVLAAAAPLAWAQGNPATRAPGAGFADPARPAPRPAPADDGVVWRAPGVDTLATVRQRGLLRVCVVPAEPMVMNTADGGFVGYSVDLARQLAQDLGVGLALLPSSWGLVVSDLLQRQCDLIASGLWVTLPRALVVHFSRPTAFDAVHLVASQASAPGKSSLADFDQPAMAVAVYAGTPQEALARKLLPRARLLATADDPLQAVLDGKAQAALVPTLLPQTLLQAAPGKLYLPRSTPLASTPTAMAVRKGDPDFLHFINTWLGLQRDSGWLDERLLHWSDSAKWPR
ncbi:MAG: transporter substrate-binding domain-containing protein [Pseudomonadota bacterium]